MYWRRSFLILIGGTWGKQCWSALDGRRLEDILHFGQIQLSDQGWESYAKIRRLAWVKSLTITLLKEGLDDSADIVQSVIEHFTRTEELFDNCNGEALIQS